MSTFFDPTPEERRALEALAGEIPAVEWTLVSNHPQLSMADRGAHQRQLAASKVVLRGASRLRPAISRVARAR